MGTDNVKGSFQHFSKGEDPLGNYAFTSTVRGIVNEFNLPNDEGIVSHSLL